jgi:hypothetical protein
MHFVYTASWAIFVELDSFLLFSFVLSSGVGALFALATRQVDNYSCFVRHHFFLKVF